MNVAEWDFAHAARYGEEIALELESRSWTNRQLHDQAQRLARAILAAGIQPGARVALLLPSSRELFVAASAALMSGCILVVLPTTVAEQELLGMLAHCEPQVLIAESALTPAIQRWPAPLRVLTGPDDPQSPALSSFDRLIERHVPLQAPVPRAGSDPAQLCYTSGSTGRPKAVVYTHEGVDRFWRESAAAIVDPHIQRTLLLAVPPTAYGARFIGYRVTANWRYVVMPTFHAERVLKAIEHYRIQNISLVPTMAEQLIAVANRYDCSSMREVSIGGSHVSRRLVEAVRRCFGNPDLAVTVRYGMTETGGWVSSTSVGGDGAVGRVRPGTTVRIIDRAGRELPPGTPGEVIVRAPFAAAGYWNDTELTQAVFRDGFVHTGDLGCLQADGELRILGRLKELIIQGGLNINPGEVAGVIREIPGVSDCAVVGVPNDLLGEELVACVVRDTAVQLTALDVRMHCRKHLERRKQPTRILFVQSLPKVAGGKLDVVGVRNMVLESREPLQGSDNTPALVDLPPPVRHGRVRDIVERELSAILSEEGGCPSSVETHFRPATLGERGLDSIGAVQLAHRLGAVLEVALSPTALYSHPTVDSLAALLCSKKWPAKETCDHRELPGPSAIAASGQDVAIIGIGCRLPGGVCSPSDLWELLCTERDVLREPPAERCWASNTTRRAAFLEHADRFDATFFGLGLQAEYLDPRHRMVLEVAWEALEDSGHNPFALIPQRTGVFLGISGHRYDSPDPLGTAPSMAVSYLCQFLNVRGPVLSVDTSCSSSLVALHWATRSLCEKECDVAVVGGVTLISESLFANPLGVLSPEGRSRTFDEMADGFGAGEGCVLFVLKRLVDARGAGDRIYATILGTAINHDGRSSSVTAPNPDAQKEVIESALGRAHITPSAIQYVEAHGTGTKLGDPIEVDALARVFAAREGPALAIGSVKSNIGHLEAAAGAAGVAKVALSIAHRHLPATLHCSQPNWHIPWEQIPVRVHSRAGSWPSPQQPLIAGVSSFGMSGTNAHAVLGEAPQESTSLWQQADNQIDSEQNWLLLLSASTAAALRDTAERWASFLEQNETATCRDIAYSSSCRRAHLQYRLAVPGRTRADWVEALRRFICGQSGGSISPARGPRPRLVMVFSGQGAQCSGMGRQLFETQPVFRSALQRCASLIDRYFPWRLLEEMWRAPAASRLQQTEVAQPALFALQVALYELWQSWGVEPHAVVGHSLGEVAAAFVCGALELPDAVRLVCMRAQIMAALPPTGAMIAIGLPDREANAVCAGFPRVLCLAAKNSPRSTVWSGDSEAVQSVAEHLSSRGISARRLPGSYAFHSDQIDALTERLAASLDGLKTRTARIPMRSTLTCANVQNLDGAYWARQMREPVDFAGACRTLIQEGYAFFLELGPHPVLVPALNETARSMQADTIVSMLGCLNRGAREIDSMLSALGQLHCEGFDVNWSRRYVVPGRACGLPTLQWNHASYWHVARGRPDPQPALTHASRDPPNGTGSSVLEGLPACSPGDQLLEWIVQKTGRTAGDFSRDASLDELGVDSLEMIRLRARLEERFGIRIPAADWSPALTVQQVLAIASAPPSRASKSTQSPGHRSALRWIKPGGDGPTIVWVHPVGGGVSCYRPLGQLLQFPSLAIERTSAEEEASGLRSVNALAHEYLEALSTETDLSSIVLAGWSFGALIAYEMAALRMNAGGAANVVIMIDAHVPEDVNIPLAAKAWRHGQHLGERGPAWRDVLQAFFRDVLGIRGIPTGTLDAWLDRALNASPDTQALLVRAGKAGLLVGIPLSEADALLRVFLANLSALETYLPSSYKGRVISIRATSTTGDPDRIWRRYATDLEVQSLEGDHYTIMRQPALGRLAEIVRAVLQR